MESWLVDAQFPTIKWPQNRVTNWRLNIAISATVVVIFNVTSAASISAKRTAAFAHHRRVDFEYAPNSVSIRLMLTLSTKSKSRKTTEGGGGKKDLVYKGEALRVNSSRRNNAVIISQVKNTRYSSTVKNRSRSSKLWWSSVVEWREFQSYGM